MSPSPKDSLIALRSSLLALHRELIESERAVFERSAGRIPSAAAFLQLLAHDPWFEWMRPLSQLISSLDESLADPENPVTADSAERLHQQVRALLFPKEKADGFPQNYLEVLQRDPNVAVAHADLRQHFAAAA